MIPVAGIDRDLRAGDRVALTRDMVGSLAPPGGRSSSSILLCDCESGSSATVLAVDGDRILLVVETLPLRWVWVIGDEVRWIGEVGR